MRAAAGPKRASSRSRSGALLPGRGPTAHSTVDSSRSGSRQVSISASESAAMTRNSAVPGWASTSWRALSTV